jgi:hypothetical protein
VGLSSSSRRTDVPSPTEFFLAMLRRLRRQRSEAW